MRVEKGEIRIKNRDRNEKGTDLENLIREVVGSCLCLPEQSLDQSVLVCFATCAIKINTMGMKTLPFLGCAKLISRRRPSMAANLLRDTAWVASATFVKKT